MTYTTITRTKWGIRHGNLSCCWSRWSWMSTRAHEYIGLSPITTRGSVEFEDNHTCICMEVMRACMFEYHFTTLMWRVRRKSYTLPTQSEIGSWRIVVLATSTRWEGFMRTHACVCAETVSCMSSQSKNNNPLLSQINLSCCQAKSSDGPSGPTEGEHQYRWQLLKWVREDNHHRFACGPNVYMLNTQNAQLWCATCLKNRKPCTHTERGSYQAYYIWWSPSPLFTAYYMLLP